ncbi:MAG: phosphatidylserine decarboxylase [Chlamydiota bacterium]
MRITVYERETGELFEEKVYGRIFIEMLYSRGWLVKKLAFFLRLLITQMSFLSKGYGLLQKTAWSRWKVSRFITKFQIDPTEFEQPVAAFQSFNDFFIRSLKPACRPVALDANTAIMPADGRYLVFPSIDQSKGFYAKNQTFNLSQLLRDPVLANHYHRGGLVIARLCPTDCHRFWFPCDCVPSEPKRIRGPLYSVNPIALRDRLAILAENDRMITMLQTRAFGDVLFIEIGATFVGAIKQTYCPMAARAKGDEKGYFEFGGSCILLLFEPNRIHFDADLIRASNAYTETRGKMGQPLGRTAAPTRADQ